MDDVSNFSQKTVALYLAAPAFFNWFAGIFLAVLFALIGGAFWLANKLGDAENAGLKAENSALKERLNLAKELSSGSAELEELRGKVEKLVGQIDAKAPEAEIKNTLGAVQENANRVVTANNAAIVSVSTQPGVRIYSYEPKKSIWRTKLRSD